MSVQIIAKCVCCGHKEDASHHFGKDCPMCPKCSSPMVAETVKSVRELKAKGTLAVPRGRNSLLGQSNKDRK